MDERRKAEITERAFEARPERVTFAGVPDSPSREMTELEKLEKAFIYHPARPDQEYSYGLVRQAGKVLALAILAHAPRCADRTAAIRKVREAVMTANAAIALNGLI